MSKKDAPAVNKLSEKEQVVAKIAGQVEAAKALAGRIGHAAVICRNGSTYFVHDSWLEVKRPAIALVFVSANGTRVPVPGAPK